MHCCLWRLIRVALQFDPPTKAAVTPSLAAVFPNKMITPQVVIAAAQAKDALIGQPATVTTVEDTKPFYVPPPPQWVSFCGCVCAVFIVLQSGVMESARNRALEAEVQRLRGQVQELQNLKSTCVIL